MRESKYAVGCQLSAVGLIESLQPLVLRCFSFQVMLQRVAVVRALKRRLGQFTASLRTRVLAEPGLQASENED